MEVFYIYLIIRHLLFFNGNNRISIILLSYDYKTYSCTFTAPIVVQPYIYSRTTAELWSYNYRAQSEKMEDSKATEEKKPQQTSFSFKEL